MAEGEKESGKCPSGLANAFVEQLHTSLIRDWRVVECKGAARAGKRADIGFFVKSNSQFFFRPDRKPVVEGFAPSTILEGDWSATKILTAADAPGTQQSAKGFVTA